MMEERTAGNGALDALYAELAKGTGVTMKQLRAWTQKTKFDAEYSAMLGSRVSCAAVATLCEPLIKRVGELPEEGLLPYAYEALSVGLYPYSGAPRSTKGQKVALKLFLSVLSRLMDAETMSARSCSLKAFLAGGASASSRTVHCAGRAKGSMDSRGIGFRVRITVSSGMRLLKM